MRSNSSAIRLILSIAIVAILKTTSVGAVKNDSAVYWLGNLDGSAHKQNFTLHNSFHVSNRPEEASIRLAADFCKATLWLNGKSIKSVSPFDHPIAFDVTRYLKSGENKLRLSVDGDGGPVAVAAELSFRVNGNQRIIATNESWQNATSFGRVDLEHWWMIKERPSTNAFDEYNQWKEVNSTTAKFKLPKGFQVDVLYEVPREFGSWISMSIDDQGRLLIGKEKKGILRLTLKKGESPEIQTIDDQLQGIHGLEWTRHGLFVNASDSRAMFRLRGKQGNDRLDEVTKLLDIPGGKGDHGRNDLTLGPDGLIYWLNGDAVDPANGFTSRVPSTNEFHDGESISDTDHEAVLAPPRGGFLARTETDGSSFEIVAAGLRNPYGVAFNSDGEPFTYDADSERHTGLPWYRPTRMNHLVVGTDYGWRARGQRPLPIYHPDFLPPNALIGRGSPTSAKFGYKSHFPLRYKNAFIVSDWSFGRIFAVQVVPRGASYSMHPETFVRGRPLNVVDLEFAADGSMYILTGGNGSRSVIYRLRYVGPPDEERAPTKQEVARNEYSQQMRALRQKLESLQIAKSHTTATRRLIYDGMANDDRWIRNAARIALEKSGDKDLWTQVLDSNNPSIRLAGMLAATRCPAPPFQFPAAFPGLIELDWHGLTPENLQVVVRICQLEAHFGEAVPEAVLSKLEAIYPSETRTLNREICSLLTSQGSDQVVKPTLEILAAEENQVDKLHYLMELSKCSSGWSKSTRTEYFRLLQGAKLSLGDEGMPDFIREISTAALSQIPKAKRKEYQHILSFDSASHTDQQPATSRKFVRKWSLDDLVGNLPQGDSARGKQLYREAQCASCHRIGVVGRSFGPDLTDVAGRYRQEEIIRSIVDPSATISSRFTNHVVETEDGRTITGRVVWNGFRKSFIRIATNPMRLDQVTQLHKDEISSYRESPISPMPEGLLNTLHRQEIADLMKFIEEH